MDLPTRLLPTRDSGSGDYAVTRWYFLDLPQGITAEHIVNPDFWQHVAAKFKVNHEIVAVAADGSFDAELRVIAVDPRKLWAQTRILRMTKPEGVEHKMVPQWPDKEGYVVEFDRVHKFRIVNRNGEVVAQDFPDEAGAIDALHNLKAAKKRAA